MALSEKEPLIVKKKNHKFYLWVAPNGNVEYKVDGDNEKRIAKALTDGKVLFKETLELFVGDAVEFTDGIVLDELDYATLKAEQNLALKSHGEKKDEVRELSLENKNKKELLSMVDKWNKTTVKTMTRKRGQVKTKEKYVIHTFVIGRETFRMIERMRDGIRIINPDYKILTEYKKAGGIAVKKGDVLFWKYYFEEDKQSETDPSKRKGAWKIARRLSFNEQICYEIINRYGSFKE